MFCQRIFCSLNVKAQGVWGWGQGEGWGFQLPIIMISVTLQKLNKKNPLIVSFHFLQHVDLCECHPFIFMTSSTIVWEPCNCLFESSELSSGIPAVGVQQEWGRQAKWRSSGSHYWKMLSKSKLSMCPVEVSRYCSREGHHLPPYCYVSFELYPSELKDRSSLFRQNCLWEAPVESSHPEDGLCARDPKVIRRSSHLQILWQGFYKQVQGSLYDGFCKTLSSQQKFSI